MFSNLSKLVVIATSVFIISCNGDDPVVTPIDYTSSLENIANDVILPTYATLNIKTEALQTALVSLRLLPDESSLHNAREAWRAARKPWEQSEGFLFGPVDQQGIDPAIDSWPVNETDLEAVLNSGTTLTKTYIDGLDGTLKGFHTIEYLLFGIDGNKPIGAFTAREFQYLDACAQSLTGATLQLFSSWNSAGENYIANLLHAGNTDLSIYQSQKSAIEEIVTGLIVIADEVGNGKINDPFVQQDLTLEESRFSANSKQDFADNIRSIENIYLGTFDNQVGAGIAAIVKARNEALDQQIKNEIAEAIDAIEAIEGTFTTAIFNATASVQHAQTKVRDLQQTLESQLLPLITNL